MTPSAKGFYWAKWRIADDDTRDGDELTPSDEWECVYVFVNCYDGDSDEPFRVLVAGVETSQHIENFYWGDKVIEHGGH